MTDDPGWFDLFASDDPGWFDLFAECLRAQTLGAGIARISRTGSLPSCVRWWVIGKDHTGQPIRVPSFRTRREAREWAANNGYEVSK